MYVTLLKIRWKKLDLTERMQIDSFGQIEGANWHNYKFMVQINNLSQIYGAFWQFYLLYMHNYDSVAKFVGRSAFIILSMENGMQEFEGNISRSHPRYLMCHHAKSHQAIEEFIRMSSRTSRTCIWKIYERTRIYTPCRHLARVYVPETRSPKQKPPAGNCSAIFWLYIYI